MTLQEFNHALQLRDWHAGRVQRYLGGAPRTYPDGSRETKAEAVRSMLVHKQLTDFLGDGLELDLTKEEQERVWKGGTNKKGPRRRVG